MSASRIVFDCAVRTGQHPGILLTQLGRDNISLVEDLLGRFVDDPDKHIGEQCCMSFDPCLPSVVARGPILPGALLRTRRGSDSTRVEHTHKFFDPNAATHDLSFVLEEGRAHFLHHRSVVSGEPFVASGELVHPRDEGGLYLGW